jgi:hypothetical protein
MMNIPVEYLDHAGKTTNPTYSLSRIGFIKHLAMAGQGYALRPQKLMRTLGMYLHYSSYLQRTSFNANHFSQPPAGLSDPTEKGQFSNLAGKAIADFLSKRIGNSFFTVGYEGAMRLAGFPVEGGRPDLIAYSPTSMFAIEAKGRSQGSSGDMVEHKEQSQEGPIAVNYSVAAVSYNLYNQVACKYHDPINGEVRYDNDALGRASRIYYSGLSEFLKQEIFESQKINIKDEQFYEISLDKRKLDKIFPEEFPFGLLWHHEIFGFYQPKLILPANINDLAKNGVSNEIRPFTPIDADGLYIDTDRIGLSIAR